jgi:hypothetical protein
MPAMSFEIGPRPYGKSAGYQFAWRMWNPGEFHRASEGQCGATFRIYPTYGIRVSNVVIGLALMA